MSTTWTIFVVTFFALVNCKPQNVPSEEQISMFERGTSVDIEKSTRDILEKIAKVNQQQGLERRTPQYHPFFRWDGVGRSGFKFPTDPFTNPILQYTENEDNNEETNVGVQARTPSTTPKEVEETPPPGQYIKRKITHQQTFYVAPNQYQFYNPQQSVDNLKNVMGNQQLPQFPYYFQQPQRPAGKQFQSPLSQYFPIIIKDPLIQMYNAFTSMIEYGQAGGGGAGGGACAKQPPKKKTREIGDSKGKIVFPDDLETTSTSHSSLLPLNVDGSSEKLPKSKLGIVRIATDPSAAKITSKDISTDEISAEDQPLEYFTTNKGSMEFPLGTSSSGKSQNPPGLSSQPQNVRLGKPDVNSLLLPLALTTTNQVRTSDQQGNPSRTVDNAENASAKDAAQSPTKAELLPAETSAVGNSQNLNSQPNIVPIVLRMQSPEQFNLEQSSSSETLPNSSLGPQPSSDIISRSSTSKSSKEIDPNSQIDSITIENLKITSQPQSQPSNRAMNYEIFYDTPPKITINSSSSSNPSILDIENLTIRQSKQVQSASAENARYSPPNRDQTLHEDELEDSAKAEGVDISNAVRKKLFSKDNTGSGIFIHKLKVRKGGVAIAGPGGIATAGSGGTAIVGPNGFAYTHPDSLAIAGSGTKVVAVEPFINLSEIVEESSINKTRGQGHVPRVGKIVAIGPVVYYNQGR